MTGARPPVLKPAGGRKSIGTFVKTDSMNVVEILGTCHLDFIVLDAEHAPLDRAAIDRMLLAASAVGLPAMVRVADQRDATILSALDLGAGGIVVPHVDDARQARDVLAAARFIGGRRGISLSARFAAHGTRPRREVIAEADTALVVCQIESVAALDQVDEIAAVAGLGGLLVGRADLALSMGVEETDAPTVLAAALRIARAARRNGLPIVVACGGLGDVAGLRDLDADAFIVGSDQSLLREAALRLTTASGPSFNLAQD